MSFNIVTCILNHFSGAKTKESKLFSNFPLAVFRGHWIFMFKFFGIKLSNLKSDSFITRKQIRNYPTLLKKTYKGTPKIKGIKKFKRYHKCTKPGRNMGHRRDYLEANIVY